MSHPAGERIRSVRAELLARTDLAGSDLRRELSAAYDAWLAGLLPDVDGVALLAVGGLGRLEPAPYGDLDLVLLHDGRHGRDEGIGQIADTVWYPIWDSGVSLDHSVRTVEQTVRIAATDARAALGLLDARHVAGDRALSGAARKAVLDSWRSTAATHLPELRELGEFRARTVGELAHLIEPDLKEAYGGIRDAHVLRALAAAQLADRPAQPVRDALDVLLDTRAAVQLRNRRPVNRLMQQDQPEVAHAIGLADEDVLLRTVASAGRTIAYALDSGWRAVAGEVGRRSARWRSRRRRPARRPLADGVIAHRDSGGELVTLALSAEPAWDPLLPLRVAAAAAVHDLPVAESTWRRLARDCPPLPTPWPGSARDALLRLLGAGRPAVGVIESMDQHGLWQRLFPEWENVRSLPQRDPLHRWTVDRHLVETAAETARLARDVSRPDLLAFAAVLHDLGKGYGVDHAVRGRDLAVAVGRRMGLPAGDLDILATLVEQHLLLPEVATRRNPDDPATIDAVVAAIDGSPVVLELLHALTIADARATGPQAYTAWRARLVEDLVHRVEAALTGVRPSPPRLTETQRLAARSGRLVVLVGEPEPAEVDADLTALGPPRGVPRGEPVTVTVAAPDRPGLLSLIAGVFALHHLDLLSATVTTEGERAVNVFGVLPHFGEVPEATLLRADLEAALAGTLSLADRLSRRAAGETTSVVSGISPAQARPESGVRVLWFDDQATDATVVEVRAADSVGLLYRLTRALAECGMAVRGARASTLGTSVVDAFYVVAGDGELVTDVEQRARVDAALRAAVTSH